jgi:hypothetical protein
MIHIDQPMAQELIVQLEDWPGPETMDGRDQGTAAKLS